jgi:hypothetical protein
VCTVCDLSISSFQEWKVHERTEHVERGGWLCLECLGSRHALHMNREQLEKHRASIHTSVTESDLENCYVGKNWQTTYYCGFCIRGPRGAFETHSGSLSEWGDDSRLETHPATRGRCKGLRYDVSVNTRRSLLTTMIARAVKLCTEGTSILSSRTAVIALPKKCTIIIRAEDGKKHTISLSQKLESAPLGFALIRLL